MRFRRRTRIVVVVLVITMVGLGAALVTRGMGFTARANPSFAEQRTMRIARAWAMPPQIRDTANPVPASPEVVRGAMEHWADHCAACHGNDGSGRTSMGRNFYPPAPDMREASTQTMTDGALFYVIEQGVPFTGMPAWGNGTPEGVRESWALVRFIRHLPQLSTEEIARMEQLNPKGQGQAERDKRIDDFLNGKTEQ